MTNEEAIKVLNTIDNCLKGNGYDWEHEGIKTAIQALEKQIPKTPMCRHYENEGERPYIKITCPAGCRVQVTPRDKYFGKRLEGWQELDEGLESVSKNVGEKPQRRQSDQRRHRFSQDKSPQDEIQEENRGEVFR